MQPCLISYILTTESWDYWTKCSRLIQPSHNYPVRIHEWSSCCENLFHYTACTQCSRVSGSTYTQEFILSDMIWKQVLQLWTWTQQSKFKHRNSRYPNKYNICGSWLSSESKDHCLWVDVYLFTRTIIVREFMFIFQSRDSSVVHPLEPETWQGAGWLGLI